MSFMGSFSGQYGPSAKVADGRLVLSLPDAETPAIWVMDLVDAATSVLRLETDRQGFYVIRRHGVGKSAAETVAVYRNRDAAARALARASRALEKARNTRPLVGPNAQPVVIRPASKVARVFNILLVAWFLLYLSGLDQFVLRWALAPLYRDQMQTMEQQAAKQLEEYQKQSDPAKAAPLKGPEGVGVPLSADEFLKNMRENPPMVP